MKTPKEVKKDTTPLTLNAGADAILALVTPFLSKDATREVLTKAAVLGKHLYATDGHRLIRTPWDAVILGGSKKPKDGPYDLLKAGKEYILRPSSEDLTPPNYLAVTKAQDRPEPFSFEWQNDHRSSDLRRRSSLAFSLASWGVCLDFEQIKAVPLGLTYKVSGHRNNYGPIYFETAKKSAPEVFCIIMPYRTEGAPRYTGPTKEEALHTDCISFVQGYRHAQFQSTQTARLKALEPLDALTKDLARRIEGRA